MRDGRVAEVRAYFCAERAVEIDTELADFPYAERGYLIRSIR